MSREKQIDEMAKIIDDNHGFIVSSVETAEALYNAGYRKQSDLTPCDFCRFNPPSSADGKPCLVCPAQAKGGAE